MQLILGVAEGQIYDHTFNKIFNINSSGIPSSILAGPYTADPDYIGWTGSLRPVRLKPVEYENSPPGLWGIEYVYPNTAQYIYSVKIVSKGGKVTAQGKLVSSDENVDNQLAQDISKDVASGLIGMGGSFWLGKVATASNTSNLVARSSTAALMIAKRIPAVALVAVGIEGLKMLSDVFFDIMKNTSIEVPEKPPTVKVSAGSLLLVPMSDTATYTDTAGGAETAPSSYERQAEFLKQDTETQAQEDYLDSLADDICFQFESYIHALESWSFSYNALEQVFTEQGRIDVVAHIRQLIKQSATYRYETYKVEKSDYTIIVDAIDNHRLSIENLTNLLTSSSFHLTSDEIVSILNRYFQIRKDSDDNYTDFHLLSGEVSSYLYENYPNLAENFANLADKAYITSNEGVSLYFQEEE